MQIALFIVATFAASVAAYNQEQVSGDRAVVETLERQWLTSEHDGFTLQQITADDFLHPVAAGVFLTKPNTLSGRSTIQHQPIAANTQYVDQMRIRIYDNVDIVTGIVVSTGDQRS